MFSYCAIGAGAVHGDAALGASVGLVGRAKLSARDSLRQGVSNLRDPFVLGGLALTGGSLIGDTLDRRGGTADDAVKNGTTAKFTTSKAASGAVTGGLTGATLGFAAGGPIGAAIGGGAGAVIGFIQALRDAADQIRDAKIGEATSNITKNLDNLTKGYQKFSPEIATNILSKQKEQDELINKKAGEEAGSSFGTSGSGFQSFLTTRNRLRNEEFNRQAPGLVNTLNNSAEQFGKNNSRDEDVTETGRKSVFDRFLKENNGFAQSQVDRIAKEHNVDPSVIKDQFFKVFKDAQTGTRAQNRADQSKFDVGRTTTAFDALTTIVKTASENLAEMGASSKRVTDLFEGQIGNVQLTNNAEVLGNPATGNRDRFLSAADSVASNFGSAGGQIRGTASGLNAVSSLLPEVLRKVHEQNPTEENFQTAVSTQLTSLLDKKGLLNADTKRISNIAVSNLDQKKFTELLKETGGDTSKVSEKALSEVSDPFKQIAEIERRFVQAAQEYVGGLETLAQRQQKITQDKFRADNLTLEAQKGQAKLDAEKAGRRTDFEKFLPEGALKNPFQNLQESLVGPGVNPTSPEEIGQALKETIDKVKPAEDKLNKARLNRPNDEAGFQNASKAFVDLKSQSSNLQTALKNLADTTLRMSAIQEKLNKLKEQEGNALSLAEKLATADPEERARFNNGAVLAQVAKDQNFKTDNFSGENLKQLFEFARQVGPNQVPGLGINGKDLTENVQRNLPGFGEFFGKKDQKDLNEAKGEEQKILEDAAQAQKELIENQKGLQTDFFKQLGDNQTKFLEDLKNGIAGFTATQANIDVVKKTSDKQKLEQLSPDAKVLSSIGVTDQSQVKALAASKDDISKFVTASAQVAKIDSLDKSKLQGGGSDELLKKADLFGSGTRRGGSNRVTSASNLEKLGNLSEILSSEGGLGDELAQKVTKRFADKQNAVDNISSRGNNLEKALAEVVGTERGKALQNQQDVRNKLGGPNGVIGDKVLNNLGAVGAKPTADLNISKVMQAAEAFSTSAVPIQNFRSKITEATDELNKLKEAAAALNAVLPQPGNRAGPVAQGNAMGGPIFRRQGTDTVPAMLTEGEFVVKRDQAKKHAGLLNDINSGKTLNIWPRVGLRTRGN
jgi:hypothetical protein